MQNLVLQPKNKLTLYSPDFCPLEAQLLLFASWDALYFPTPWALEEWALLYKNKRNSNLFYFLSYLEPCGFLLSSHCKGEEVAHILKFLLLPEYRRMGYSQILWNFHQKALFSEGIDQLYLEVESKNLVALSFYQHQGLSCVAHKKNYYGQERDAFCLHGKIRP